MTTRTRFLFKTMHAWDKETVNKHLTWLAGHGYGADQVRLWVFRYKSGADWAYLITAPGHSWTEAHEGHIRLAIRDGWEPEQITVEYFK